MKILNHFIAVLLLAGWVGSANATLITISTDSTFTGQPSYTFGDWIFELVTPANSGFNLIDDVTEDFIVSNICCGGEFTLRRLDNKAFNLLGVRIGGGGGSIGNVAIPGPGSKVFQNFLFSGQADVTNVNSILFSPGGFIQLSAFDVAEVSVPAPATLALFIIGLSGLGWSRRKKA